MEIGLLLFIVLVTVGGAVVKALISARIARGSRMFPSPFGGVAPPAVDMESLFKQIEALTNQTIAGRQDLPFGAPPMTGGGTPMPPQLQRLMAKAQSDMRHLDSLSRQRYENKVADLMATAGEAGLTWKPPGY
jgi:hypothetical protein